ARIRVPADPGRSVEHHRRGDLRDRAGGGAYLRDLGSTHDPELLGRDAHAVVSEAVDRGLAGDEDEVVEGVDRTGGDGLVTVAVVELHVGEVPIAHTVDVVHAVVDVEGRPQARHHQRV